MTPLLDPHPAETLERVALAIIEGRAKPKDAVDLLAIRYQIIGEGQRTMEKILFKARMGIS